MDSHDKIAEFLKRTQFPLEVPNVKFDTSQVISFARFELLYSKDKKTSRYTIHPKYFVQYPKNNPTAFAFDVFMPGTNTKALFCGHKDEENNWKMFGPLKNKSQIFRSEPFLREVRDQNFPDGYSINLSIITPGLGSVHYFLEIDSLRIIVPGELIDGHIKNSLHKNRRVFTLWRNTVTEEWIVKLS